MSDIILEIKNLNHAYNENDSILKNINLEIISGERIAILGPSGCGKSTLLRLIAGLEKPNEGDIKISGDLVSSKDILVPPEKRNIGLVVQEKALFPHLSIQENISFGIKKNKEKDSIVSDLLALFKIDGLKNKYPHEISGGEQQRAALARSLAPNPKFLMLDEPFSALDKDLKESLYEEISEVFLNKNSTILLVTHDMNEAEIMTNKQINMQNGKLL
jgi:iron(III) transport system ATP-binding protein|tara:strand:+ start:7864 stop:8514 length:651 start_codon:yes stop_codon:yes gene_type:complete